MRTLSSRIPPKRQVTIDELIGEMERVIKYDTAERVRIPRGAIVETVDLELGEHDIEADMDRLMDRIRQDTDSQGWSMFSRLTDGNSLREVVYNLLCLLHLVQMKMIDVRQDKMFGEIFIHYIKKG